MSTIIVGMQFGDEGKGKITDWLCDQSDWVVRFAGGNNAGHTVVVGEKTYKFHILPSGLARKKSSCVAAGCVVDPKVLVKELSQFNGESVPLHIDPRAQMILPYHVLQDSASERKAGERKIGTTGRGIGPCYSDRALRVGVRFIDFVSKERFLPALNALYDSKKAFLESVYDKEEIPSPEQVFEEYSAYADQLKPYLGDVSKIVYNALERKQRVLFEGAQGTFLDNDFGTYPFVTSSHPIAGNAFVGTGIGPTPSPRIVGVTKAYTTRVGSGPFPTELTDENGKHILEKGVEFGTTTGRPRRCGWLDLNQLRAAKRVNGVTEIAVMKLDVLNGLKEVRACTHYELNGEKIFEPPVDVRSWIDCVPVYQSFDSFELDSDAKKFGDLPKQAREYIEFVERELKVPISMVSIGPERNQTVLRN